MYDVIIVGAGPAGISASLYTKRGNLNVLVLYRGESQLEKAHMIDNYYGFPGGISGKDLYEAGIEQAKKLGVDVKEEEVTNIEMVDLGKYKVKTEENEYENSYADLEFNVTFKTKMHQILHICMMSFMVVNL